MTESAAGPQENHELAKAYEFKSVESKWLAAWEKNRSFAATIRDGAPSYCIVIPPPNVTGVLHVGHALNNTLQDLLTRYHRMLGDNTLWLPGTDHAGIATQNVVERQLATEGTSRHDIGREAFIERVWAWRQEKGGTIINQLKRLGCSCDWERERFTMDEGLSRAVREVFVKLYNDGLIYKGDYIVNWCPRCHTALADDEVEHEPTNGKLYNIRYPFADGSGHLVVATTRPETMLGDTGVAVHPDDERYRDMENLTVLLPLTNRTIPVVFDHHVQKDFGTGALKVTPSHDRDDYEIGIRHNLELLKIMDQNGVMNEAAGKYAGLDRFACRKQIVADLEAQGYLVSIDDYQHGVGHCYRCHTVVEPTTSLQWFVSVRPLADKATAAVRDGRIRIMPKTWDNTFYNWMDNIRDWCISRQIWWGHRIPAWTCSACGEIIVASVDPTHCPKCTSAELVQETDVLDTWFSSALWPFSTLGWPDKTPELTAFYPTAVLITSFDILFFWVARMMMMGLHFMDEIPFRDVYLHALVRDKDGKKMSKSTGNVIDPLAVMDTYGTDALRFTLAAFAAQGRDIRLDEDRIEGYRHFINKIWNAARFALMHINTCDPAVTGNLAVANLGLPHRWILSRTNRTIADVRRALDDYRFNDAASAVYHFTWHEFCDWYLEWIKSDLYGSDTRKSEQAKTVLFAVLEILLKLLHPFTPFVTEEIWEVLPGKRNTLMTEKFPEVKNAWDDTETEKTVSLLMGVIGAIRNIRSEMMIHPSAAIEVIMICHDQDKTARLKHEASTICSLTRSEKISIINDGERPAGSAVSIFEDIEIFVPMKGLVDVAKETERLLREKEKLALNLQRSAGKLTNDKFLANAPAEVIAKEKDKVEGLQATMAKIDDSLKRLAELS
ncbi:MAG: valine--tRNA ligase [Proteobacteria bacterium]|nr:valine--tRNA ligase [Pseudomonadota bacterium]MBU1739248.1 valine--tRNA ligase [Pseudomonadota bacterium]